MSAPTSDLRLALLPSTLCRKVFVCARFPAHHCRACFPLEAALAEPASPPAAAAAAPPPLAAVAAPRRAAGDDADAALPFADTPSSQCIGSPPVPAAPSKDTGSAASGRSRGRGASDATSKAAAARSLAPVFNNFSAAALRAAQLGGRFATLRPAAHAVARRQRQLAAPWPASPSPDGAAAAGARKRARPAPSPASAAGAAALSVGTAAQSVEPAPRLTTWIAASPRQAAAPGRRLRD
jgi:hypothetical protein